MFLLINLVFCLQNTWLNSVALRYIISKPTTFKGTSLHKAAPVKNTAGFSQNLFY